MSKRTNKNHIHNNKMFKANSVFTGSCCQHQYSLLVLHERSSISSSLKRASLVFRAFLGFRLIDTVTSFFILDPADRFRRTIFSEYTFVTPPRSLRRSSLGPLNSSIVCLHSHAPKQNAPSHRQQSRPLTNEGYHEDNCFATISLSRISRDFWTTCTSAVDTEAVIATPSSEIQLQLQWNAVRLSLYSTALNASASKSKLQVIRITRNNEQSRILLNSSDFVHLIRPNHGFPRSVE